MRSYPKPPSPNTVDMWVAQAFTNVTKTWTSYVKGGGIPAVFGEWTLAGAWQRFMTLLPLGVGLRGQAGRGSRGDPAANQRLCQAVGSAPASMTSGSATWSSLGLGHCQGEIIVRTYRQTLPSYLRLARGIIPC